MKVEFTFNNIDYDILWFIEDFLEDKNIKYTYEEIEEHDEDEEEEYNYCNQLEEYNRFYKDED